MKKILTATLAFVLFAGAATAQSKDSSEHRHGKRGHEMFKDLNLSTAQKAKLKSIHEAEHSQMKSLKTQGLTAEQSKAQREELHKKFRSETEAVFTPEQKQQLDKKRAEWKANGKFKDHSGKEGRADRWNKGGRDFAKDLNLSQDQQDKMTRLRADSKQNFEAIRSDKTLTEEQKKQRMQELKKQQHEQMKNILTAEQLEKMKASRKEHSEKNTKK